MPCSLVEKYHPLIRLFATRRQALVEAADVQLQLVAVRVEEIVRRAFAFIGFPYRDASRIQPSGKKCEIRLRNAERVVGVVALLRRNDAPLRVQRQSQPEVAAGEIRAVIPAGA